MLISDEPARITYPGDVARNARIGDLPIDEVGGDAPGIIAVRQADLGEPDIADRRADRIGEQSDIVAAGKRALTWSSRLRMVMLAMGPVRYRCLSPPVVQSGHAGIGLEMGRDAAVEMHVQTEAVSVLQIGPQ